MLFIDGFIGQSFYLDERLRLAGLFVCVKGAGFLGTRVYFAVVNFTTSGCDSAFRLY